MISAANPNAPSLIGSLAVAGLPAALAVRGNAVAIAAQTAGVAFVDITNPSAPTLISTIATAGPAVGIDLDLRRGLAAVAMRTAGMQLIDISNLQAPQLRGTLAGGNVRQVLIRYPAVLLADALRSFSASDITNINQPVLSLSVPASQGGAPVEIAAVGVTSIIAESSMGLGVPVFNISNPLIPALALNWTYSPPAYSTSIAMDNIYGYLILPSLLRIFKYQNITDSLGVPPVVTITSPLSGTQLIHGQTITLTANATDDIGLVSVNFLVNGQVVSSTTSAPYQFTYIVPSSATMLTFGATAVDYGNNVGTAANIVVQVIPDPGTTAMGRVVDPASNPVAGAIVSALARSATTTAGGTFTISGLPTLQGSIVFAVTATLNGVFHSARTSPLSPVLGGITNVGDIRIFPTPVISSISPAYGRVGSVVSAVVAGQNLLGATFSLLSPIPADSSVAGTIAVLTNTGSLATLQLSLGSTMGQYALLANTAAGTSAITGTNQFSVLAGQFTATSSSVSTLNAQNNWPTTFTQPPGRNSAQSFSASVLNTFSPWNTNLTQPAGRNSAQSFSASVLNAQWNPALAWTPGLGRNTAIGLNVSVCNRPSGCPQTTSSISLSAALAVVTVKPPSDKKSISDTVPTLSPVSPMRALVVGKSIRLTVPILKASTVEFEVNGAIVGAVSEAPYELLFTVPSGVPLLTFRAWIHREDGETALTPSEMVSVVADSGSPVDVPAIKEDESIQIAAGGLKAEYFAIDRSIDRRTAGLR